MMKRYIISYADQMSRDIYKWTGSDEDAQLMRDILKRENYSHNERRHPNKPFDHFTMVLESEWIGDLEIFNPNKNIWMKDESWTWDFPAAQYD